jgi:MFS family permease
VSSVLVPEEITELAEPKASIAEVVEHGGEKLTIDTPLKVVITSSFVLRLAGALTASLLGAYLRQVLNAGPELIGILAALFYVTELTLSPIFGALSDLRGRRPILVLGPLLGVIALPIYPLSSLTSIGILTIGILAFTRLIEGISTAAKVPSALGYLADATAGEGKARASLRGRVMGYYEITFLVGFVSGYILGGYLWEGIGQYGFFLVSLIYLVATLMLFFFVPESLPEEARKHHLESKMSVADAAHPVRTLLRSRVRAYASLLREPALRGFVPAWLAINAVVGLLGNLVQPMLLKPKIPLVDLLSSGFNSVLGLAGSAANTNTLPLLPITTVFKTYPDQILDGKFDPSGAGIAFGGIGLVFMIGIFVWSLFYARIRKSNVMLVSIVGLAIVCIALFGINNSWLPQLGSSWLFLPLLITGIFMVSGFTPVALAYLAEISGTRVEHRGAVMGLYSVFLGLGQLIGSGGGGVFVKAIDQGFNGLIIGVAILGVTAGAAVMFLRAQHKI